MTESLHELSVVEQARLLADGQLSSIELVDHYLSRIDALNGQLNAYVNFDAELSRERARAADELRRQGAATPLTGIPIAHKDIFCTRNLPTTCGSQMLENYLSPYDATVVSKLKSAGLVVLGKTNMDEFAMGSSNENSYFGPVSNPWDLARVPGGSSGGSAAVVAAGLAPLATATDTGGSIRQPAAYCGVTGIKPTYGRVSRYGMVAFASSLDQGGPIGRSAEDCAYLLAAMAGHDPRDATSLDVKVPDYLAALEADVKGLRIGIPEEYFNDKLDADIAEAVHEALATLEKLGAKLVSVSLPRQSLCVPAYYVIAPAEASSNLSRFDGVRFGHRAEDVDDLDELYRKSRDEGFGDEVKRRILTGTYVLPAGYFDAYYTKARQVRQLISDDFEAAFREVDVIAGPTTPTVAFEQGEEVDDPVAMYLNDIYTVAANLAGLPGMSLPCGFQNGLPIGLQLIGRSGDESTMLTLSHRYQQTSDWHLQWAPGYGGSDRREGN